MLITRLFIGFHSVSPFEHWKKKSFFSFLLWRNQSNCWFLLAIVPCRLLPNLTLLWHELSRWHQWLPGFFLRYYRICFVCFWVPWPVMTSEVAAAFKAGYRNRRQRFLSLCSCFSWRWVFFCWFSIVSFSFVLVGFDFFFFLRLVSDRAVCRMQWVGRQPWTKWFGKHPIRPSIKKISSFLVLTSERCRAVGLKDSSLLGISLYWWMIQDPTLYGP